MADTEDMWPCACVKRDSHGNPTHIKLHPPSTPRCNKCGAIKPMIQYAVYKNPLDYPDKFVVRKWFIVGTEEPIPADQPHAIEESLPAARAKIPEGFQPIGRHPTDDPCIVETWI